MLVDDSRVAMPGGLRVLGGDVCSEQSPPPLAVVPLALSSCCSLGVRLRSASLAASLAECRGRCCRDAASCRAAGDGVPSLLADAGSPTDLKVPCEGASWSPLAPSVAIHTSTIWPICALLGSVGAFRHFFILTLCRRPPCRSYSGRQLSSGVATSPLSCGVVLFGITVACTLI